MPRYFFHLRSGEDVLLDREGRQLASLEAAAAAALAEARGVVSQEVLAGRVMLCQRIDVEDEGRKLLHRLEFRDAVEVVPQCRIG